jgi:phytoene synthase
LSGLGVDLDAEVRRVDPDRWFASRFIADEAARARVIALYAFDHQLARAGAVTSNDLAAEIRLTWWREALAEIYAGADVRGHPVADALAALGWAADAEGGLARLAARSLDPANDGAAAAPAGTVWGLILLRRSGKVGGGPFDDGLRVGLAEANRAASRLSPAAFPAALPATLARADLGSGSPKDFERRARLTWSALTGRI